MRKYLSALLPALVVVSLAAAQATAPNAPDSSATQASASADSAKASASASNASAPAATVAKPDTAQSKTSTTTPKKNAKQSSTTSSGKQSSPAALAKPDSTKAKTQSSTSADKAAPAVVKTDSTKTKTPTPQGTPAPISVSAAAKPDTALGQLPPLPPMRNIITTEKAIRNNPDGVIQRPKTAMSAPAASEAAAKDSAPTASDSQAAASPALPLAAPSGTALGKADSTALAVLPPQKKDQQKAPASAPGQAQKPRKSDTFREEQTLFNCSTGNLHTMKVVIDDQYNLVGMVYGEDLGFIRVLSADNNGNFKETWKSPPLNSPVRGVFVDNLDNTGEAEIVAYTLEGNIFIFGYDTHEQKYKTPDGTYQSINCMLITNMDDDPVKELLFITKAGKMVQFDPITKFEEWTSTDTYTATDMVIGNVDNDPDTELVLNTGEVLNLRFKSVEWKMEGNLVNPNSRLYLMDMDSDDILELIIQYDQSYVRIIDVDQRREKW